MLGNFQVQSSWSVKTNSKMAMKNFSHERLRCKPLNFMVLGHPCKKSQNYGNHYTLKMFMAIFEFVGQFFFQNDVFKLQEDFSEHEMRVFLENGLRIFQKFLIL
jgi:ubiquitin C-terminal hydrolase